MQCVLWLKPQCLFAPQVEIVGVRHYSGMIGDGEFAELRREPHNQYDSNAITVHNEQGHQLGHIPNPKCNGLAKLLSPFMRDNPTVRIEAVVSCSHHSRVTTQPSASIK
jgi:hypothetical protein